MKTTFSIPTLLLAGCLFHPAGHAEVKTSPATSGNQYYLAPNGSDANSGNQHPVVIPYAAVALFPGDSAPLLIEPMSDAEGDPLTCSWSASPTMTGVELPTGCVDESHGSVMRPEGFNIIRSHADIHSRRFALLKSPIGSRNRC